MVMVPVIPRSKPDAMGTVFVAAVAVLAAMLNAVAMATLAFVIEAMDCPYSAKIAFDPVSQVIVMLPPLVVSEIAPVLPVSIQAISGLVVGVPVSL